jgi:ABC-type tungstate transport system substrate-binding protein
MSWKLIPIAIRFVPWEKVLKHAPTIVEEARKFYDSKRKDNKQEAELIKEMANQLQDMTRVMANIRFMVKSSIILGFGAIVLAFINLLK